MARMHGRKQDEETTYWLSYSDMMAGLLLCFVLIIALTVIHARVLYDEKQRELTAKEDELIIQADALKEQQDLVRTPQEPLDEQAAILLSQSTALTEKEDQLASQTEKLREQEATLLAQHSYLETLQKIMQEQQTQLDNIIGVRSELIAALKKEFEDSDLSIAVDEKTGAITFDSSILFEYNSDTLKPTGEQFLAEFLPRYCRILLGPQYQQYISEIMIEGNTDTSGGYIYNLELSQKRAFSVARFCLSDDANIVSSHYRDRLREVVSCNGRSYSNPIIDEAGNVDMDASRRVDFLFRLKDEEMIREMIEILNAERE